MTPQQHLNFNAAPAQSLCIGSMMLVYFRPPYLDLGDNLFLIRTSLSYPPNSGQSTVDLVPTRLIIYFEKDQQTDLDHIVCEGVAPTTTGRKRHVR